jgi:hypothetical protein
VGQPGFDLQSVLEFFRTLLFWLTCICAGATLLGLSIYLALLFVETAPSQARSKNRLGRDRRPVSRPQAAEENRNLPATDYEEILTEPTVLQEGD